MSLGNRGVLGQLLLSISVVSADDVVNHVEQSTQQSDLAGSLLYGVKSLPSVVQYVLAAVAFIASVLAYTRLYTTLRYRRSLAALTTTSASKSTQTFAPPRIPYTIPFLGSTVDFLAPKPGLFWTALFKQHPRSIGCCTLRLGPRTAHIIHDPHAVQALFKSKDGNRLEFNIQIARTSLGVPESDIQKYHGTDKKDRVVSRADAREEEHQLALVERINLETILKADAVNELTTELCRQMQKRFDMLQDGQEVDIAKWLRKDMFEASGRALLGEKVFEYYPTFCDEFWDFEANMLSLFFGLPEFLVLAAVRARNNGIKGFMTFHEGMAKERLDDVVSSTGEQAWEPHYGSRANRARQELYNKVGLSNRAKAGFDLGFTFGLASNAIPATAWMLLHILDPHTDKTLRPRVMAELETARSADGSLNLSVLFGLPLLASIFHEVLRLYTDVLVSRTLEKDHTLPISSLGDRKVLLRKGTLAFAPAWPGQRDADAWNGEKAADVFSAERFLTTDPETGRDVFTTAGTAGRFFPFGGGKSMCPGRVFARQEIIAATAMMLLAFEMEVVGFVDGKGRACASFPSLRDGFGGSGIILQEGDLRVRVRRRVV